MRPARGLTSIMYGSGGYGARRRAVVFGKAPATSATFLPRRDDRDVALRVAVGEGGLTMNQLANETGLSVSRVSRIVAEQELRRQSEVPRPER